MSKEQIKEQINLNKFISSSGFCSRRAADKLIEQARVTINGELVASSLPVYPGDIVEIDGEPIHKTKVRPVYLAFNKPVGVTSTTDLKDKTNIISFIGHTKRIFPIGRLDKDSDGLIFLTNDGDIVNKILRASNHHEKEYIVNVDRAVTPEFIKQMSNGVPILETVTKKCFVRQEGSRRFRIILTQGLNRQIRRMCEALEYKVVSLTRVRIMNVELGGLAPGKWRYLTLPEVDKLNTMVSASSKVDNTSGKEKKQQKESAAVVRQEQEAKRKQEAEDAELQAWIEKTEKPKGKKKSTYADFRLAAKSKGKSDDGFERKPRKKKEDDNRGKKTVAEGRGKKDTGKVKPGVKGSPAAEVKGKKGAVAAKAKPGAKPAAKAKPRVKGSTGLKETQQIKQYIPKRKSR